MKMCLATRRRPNLILPPPIVVAMSVVSRLLLFLCVNARRPEGIIITNLRNEKKENFDSTTISLFRTRKLDGHFCTEQELEFDDASATTGLKIEINLDTADTSEENQDKAITQTKKSLQKAFRKFMKLSDPFQSILRSDLDIDLFAIPEKEDILFNDPVVKEGLTMFRLTYDMPKFKTTFQYDEDECDEVESNADALSGVPEILSKELEENLNEFISYFEDDFKITENFTFNGLYTR